IDSRHVKTHGRGARLEPIGSPGWGCRTIMPFLRYIAMPVKIELELQCLQFARGKLVWHNALLRTAGPACPLMGVADHKAVRIGKHENPGFHITQPAPARKLKD